MIAFLRCLLLHPFRSLCVAREIQAAMAAHGVHTVAENCRRCGDWHIRVRRTDAETYRAA